MESTCRYVYLSLITLGLSRTDPVSTSLPQGSISNQVTLNFVLETLIESNRDLSDKFEMLQKKVTEQSSEISGLKLQFSSVEQNCETNTEHIGTTGHVDKIQDATIGRLKEILEIGSMQIQLKVTQGKLLKMEQTCMEFDHNYMKFVEEIRKKINVLHESLAVHNNGISDFKVKLLSSEELWLEKISSIQSEFSNLFDNQTKLTDELVVRNGHLEKTLEELNKELTSLKIKVLESEIRNEEKMENIIKEKHNNKDQMVTLSKQLEDNSNEIFAFRQMFSAFEDKIEDLKEDTKREIQSHNKKQLVSFSARVSPSYKDIEPGTTIVFSSVETNVGDGYDSTTGEFTAPLSGIYIFYTHILSGSNKYIETRLLINGKVKLRLYSGGGRFRGSGSNLLVIRLKTGDKAKMVKFGPWGTRPFYIHHGWSTFSGFLLTSDE